MTLTQPIKIPGGKHYIATKIIDLFPANYLHYVEPYAGGLSVLLAHNPDGHSEIVNDIYGRLTNFWHVLQGTETFNAFLRVIEAVPFSQVDYEDAKLFGDGDGAVMSAVQFFVQCRMSRSGGMKSFATISRNRVRRGMNEQASAWLNAVDGLADVHARLRRVVILCDDALRVIAQQDGPNTLFILDPPYLPEVRTADLYAHEMTFGQHCELLTLLSTIQGRFVLSGYHCPLYDNWAAKFGWRSVEFNCSNNMAGGESKDRRTEVCWMNY